MSRFWKIISSAVIFIALASCEPEHVCTFSPQWTHDADYHWHESVCHPGKTSDKAPHELDGGMTCAVCGYAAAADVSDVIVSDNFKLTKDGTLSVVDKSLAQGSVVIPSEISGVEVRKIDKDAFKGCAFLTSITIPDSVVEIGEDAFDGCASLESVHAQSLEGWRNILFANDCANPMHCASKLYVAGELAEGEARHACTFSSEWTHDAVCHWHESVCHPGKTSNKTFHDFDDTNKCRNCGYVTNIYMSDNFRLTEGGVLSVVDKSLVQGSVAIPSEISGIKVRFISDNAFYGCTSLASVTIPDSVTSIGERAFKGCASLVNIYYDGTKEQWSGVSKGSDWKPNIATVHCTDGDV